MILIIVLIVTPLFFLIANGLDPDFGWHLYFGKYIVENHHLVTTQIGYNFFAANTTVDHQWLSNILLYLGYDNIGYVGLAIISTLIIFIAFIVQYKLITPNVSRATVVISLMLMALPISIFVGGVRLQYLILLGAALLIYIAKKIPRFRGRLLLYFLIFFLGNNLHSGFLFLSIIPAFLEYNIAQPFSKAWFQKYIILGATIIVALALNPNGLGYWKLILDMLRDPIYQKNISEWLPIYQKFPADFCLMILPLTLITLPLITNAVWKKIKINELILLLIFFVLALKSVRNIPLFVILALPYFAAELEHELRLATNRKMFLLFFGGIVFVLYGTLMRQVPFGFTAVNIFERKIGYPSEGLTFYEKIKPANGNLLNNYGWGGYEIWKYPDTKIFIDGRGPQVGVGKDSTMLKEYLSFSSDDRTITTQKLAEYNITSTILSKPQPAKLDWLNMIVAKVSNIDISSFDNPQNNLIDYLKADPDWSLAYEDDISVIFIKKTELKN